LTVTYGDGTSERQVSSASTTKRQRWRNFARFCLIFLACLFVFINVIVLHIRLSARIAESASIFDPNDPSNQPLTMQDLVQKLVCSNMFDAYPAQDFPGCDYCLGTSFAPYNVTTFCVLKKLMNETKDAKAFENWGKVKDVCRWIGVECDKQLRITSL
jgi:hypothetical protein